MTTHPLLRLRELGQSVWLDNLTRASVQGGHLRGLVEEDGLSGVTSNPSTFKKAIADGEDYDDAIRRLARGGKTPREIYETLAIEDVQSAADILRPVFDRTGGDDGFVSLEVSPHLARDTQGTIDEACRLWAAVKRPNVFIKIPGTREGVPAIEECLTRGVPINITLLFSMRAHRSVIEAYWRALERRRERGETIDGVHSVASYFLSRIDVMVDKRLDAMGEKGTHTDEAKALRGRAAIASAKLAYLRWRELHEEPRWKTLEEAGARVQKCLWASTSTKDERYSDVRYVEPLIGPRTINTMPEDTIDAFRDHGRAARTLENEVDRARDERARLATIGIDMDEIAEALVEEGIRKFADPFDEMLEALESGTKAARTG